MAKKSTVANTSTTDLFIEEQLNEPTNSVHMSWGPYVSGVFVGAGAVLLGFIIYEGIKYLITRHNNKYTAIPVHNVNSNLQQLPVQQYSQYVQQPTPQQPIIPQPVQQQPVIQSEQQPIPEPQFVNTEIALNSLNTKLELILSTQRHLNNTQDTIATTMEEMVKGINIRNSQEFENLQNENAYLKQQVNALMAEKERSDSFTNHLMGQYDQLATQMGAPLSREYLNSMYGNPAETVNKYPNLNLNTPTNNIVR